MEWHVPERWNAFERNRGRAYHYLFSQLVGLESLFEAYKLFKQGERKVAALDPSALEKAIPQDERRRAQLLQPLRDGDRAVVQFLDHDTRAEILDL